MSFTLNYTGDEINAILARANNGGEIDDELALKAPLASPALTGNPTAPTQPEEDNSTKVATTEYADRAADAAGAAAEAAAKEYTDAATGALYIIDTASGSIASFSDGADGIPMRSVVVNITPVQSGSGDPSPDNVRPISGWTGAEISVTGDNLYAVGNFIEHSYLGDDGTITYTGNQNVVVFAKCKPNTIYTFSKNAGIRFRVATTTEPPKIGTPFASLSNYDGSTSHAYTTGATAEWLVAWVYNYSDGDMATMLASITINEGSTALLNEPQGTVYPISWQTQAGEVFGGTIDAVSGELKVTHGYASYNGSENWLVSTADPAAWFYVLNANLKAGRQILATNLFAQSNNTAKGCAWGVYQQIHVYPPESVAPSGQTAAGLAEFKTFLESNPLQVVYPLAQPVTYQLAPQQITSLLGQNNVWSNTGDTEVKYVADPKLYIAKITGGGTLTLGSVSPLSVNRPVTISEEDLEQAGEVNEAVEVAAEAVLPAESGETEEGAQE